MISEFELKILNKMRPYNFFERFICYVLLFNDFDSNEEESDWKLVS